MPLALMTQTDLPIGRKYYNVDEDGLALKGYDPVSYFTNGPELGKATLSYRHEGLLYRFHSEDNRIKFQETPEDYLPQYGGYCAFGLGAPAGKYGSNPEPFDVDPTSFEILNGRLYLFFKNELFRSKTYWDSENKSALIRQADSLWQAMEEKYHALKIPPGMSCKAPPETLDMAFLVGKWQINYKQRFKGGDYRETQGIWYGHFSPDGRSIIDYWGEGMPVSGINVRTFDAYTGKWSMTWNQNNSIGNKALLEGERRGDRIIFMTKYWELDPSGQYLNRITFHNIQKERFFYYIDTSTDGGKTWIEKTTIIEAHRLSETTDND